MIKKSVDCETLSVVISKACRFEGSETKDFQKLFTNVRFSDVQLSKV